MEARPRDACKSENLAAAAEHKCLPSTFQLTTLCLLLVTGSCDVKIQVLVFEPWLFCGRRTQTSITLGGRLWAAVEKAFDRAAESAHTY